MMYKVLRGGSWALLQDYVRADYRVGTHPGFCSGNLGFRVVRAPPAMGVLRGGAWENSGVAVSYVARDRIPAGNHDFTLGLRIAQDTPQPTRRGLCGGAWYNNPPFVRTAVRYKNQAGHYDNTLGFRIAQGKSTALQGIKGGSWLARPRSASFAVRFRTHAGLPTGNIGFRVSKDTIQ